MTTRMLPTAAGMTLTDALASGRVVEITIVVPDREGNAMSPVREWRALARGTFPASLPLLAGNGGTNGPTATAAALMPTRPAAFRVLRPRTDR